MYYMSTTVVSVRIPEDLLRRAKKENIVISRVVREAIERELRKRELARIAERLREEEWTDMGIDVAAEIRKDRDGGH